MKLYHGTTESAARAILAGAGLAPRGSTRKSLWADHPSNPGAVYLTNTNPVYFADHAKSRGKANDRAAVLEIDTDKLNEKLFAPDEDFIEQASRKTSLIRAKTLKARTQKARELQRRLAHHWQDSLESIGTACYFGTIPVHAITRAVALNTRATPMVSRLWLSLIDIGLGSIGFKITGASRRELLRWIFDGVADIGIVTSLFGQRQPREVFPQMWEQWEEVLTPETRSAFAEYIYGDVPFVKSVRSVENHVDIPAVPV